MKVELEKTTMHLIEKLIEMSGNPVEMQKESTLDFGMVEVNEEERVEMAANILIQDAAIKRLDRL